MRPASVWLLRLLPALLLPGPLGWAASAAEPRPAASAVAVGFDGGYRTNAWTPVTVTGDGIAPGDVLHVWAEDPDG